MPTLNLKKAIYKKVSPTLKQCLTKVSQHYKDVIEEEKRAKNALTAEHHIAQTVAKDTPTPPSIYGKVSPEEEAAKRKNKISQFTSNADEQAQLFNEFSDQPFSIVDKSWNGPNFFEITFLGGKDIIEYNTNHVFFEIFKECRDEIRDGINTEYNATRLLAF